MPDERRNSTSEPGSAPGPAWAFKIATVAGIPIRIHFTFLLFLFWIAFGQGGPNPLNLVYVLAIFSVSCCTNWDIVSSLFDITYPSSISRSIRSAESRGSRNDRRRARSC